MKSLKINNVVKVFFMALVLSLTITSCSKDDLSEGNEIEIVSSEGDTSGDKDGRD